MSCSQCDSLLCKTCSFNGKCVSCSSGFSPPEPFHDPTEDMDLQEQEWKPMKKGTGKQLESGIRVAEASIRNGLKGQQISQCLVTSSAQTAYLQARREHSTIGSLVVFHEYCCSATSALGKAMERRGSLVKRWGLWNCDLMTSSGVSKVEQSILRDRANGKSVVLWISVPCDPWCSWHRVFTYRKGYSEQLAEKRRRSLKSLKLLSGLISRLTRRSSAGPLEFASSGPETTTDGKHQK